MEPAIPTGSIIYTVQKNLYNPSDIIVFNQDGKVITHRIVGVETVDSEIFYKTKGDANDREDRVLVGRREIVGTTMISLPQIGKIVMTFQTPIGFAAGIVLPTLLFLSLEIRKYKREVSLGV